jgi:hypothetical protein
MSIAGSDRNLRALGSELAAFIVARSDEQLTTASLQAVIGDLAVDHPDLVAPLKDLVSRQSFRSVIPHASSRGGAIQRDALIQEISRIYHPAILTAIENVLNGFLETSGGVTSQLSQSIFTQDQSPICQALDDNAGVYSKPQITSSPLKSDNNESQLLSASQSYFAAAIELAKKLCGVDLATASANTSGKGLFNYILRDAVGKDLARVSLAMLDAKLRPANSIEPFKVGTINQMSAINASDVLFFKAVELAQRMGNTNLAEACAPASSKGIVNYTIRDATSNILAKVPLSMLQNAL